MSDRPKNACVDCGKRLPPASDDSTLVSIKYGWRLVRPKKDEGEARVEWRCPTCWNRYRSTRKEIA